MLNNFLVLHKEAKVFASTNFKGLKFYFNPLVDRSAILNENRGKGGVYIWTNKLNLKRYVGSSLNLGNRLAWYYVPSVLKGATAQKRISLIARALHKIGHENFTLQIVFCEPVLSVCLALEQYIMDSLNPEYNIRPAESSAGYTHSEEGKDAKRGSNNPMFGRSGLNSPRYGTIHSLETKAKWSVKRSNTIYQYNKDGELISTYLGLAQCATQLGCSQGTLARYCKDSFLFKNQWIFSYEPLDFANFVVLERPRNKKIEARRPVFLFDSTKSTLIKTFNSTLEIQNYFKADARTILRYCESGKIFKGSYILSFVV
jgi:group I intron endonuclease